MDEICLNCAYFKNNMVGYCHVLDDVVNAKDKACKHFEERDPDLWKTSYT